MHGDLYYAEIGHKAGLASYSDVNKIMATLARLRSAVTASLQFSTFSFPRRNARSFFTSSKLLRGPSNGVILGLGAGLGVGSSLIWLHSQKQSAMCVEGPTTSTLKAGQVRNGLPNYSLEEIAKHRTSESRIWVTYGDAVYDITEFAEIHPGGSEKLMLAAGGSLEPYWEVFAVHNTEEVHSILEEWRIGNITPNDRGKNKNEGKKEGPYSNDPVRSPVLKVNTREPFNAETPTVLLGDSVLTPNDLFFVRNHLPVPQVDPQTFVLEVSGEGIETLKLTLDDLRSKFKQYTVPATIQCAGNRRADLASVKKVKGLLWTGGAIGNAEWTGVRLRDVLLYAGVKDMEEYSSLQHIHLEGLDNNALTGESYGASIPIHKAMDIRGDCILAYQMNGEELPRDHGYPIRAVIPGTVGARNVKWLSKIVTSKDEYGGFWQQKDYKGFSPNVDWDTVDFSTAPAIQELPVQSLICSPKDNASLNVSDGEVCVSGIAWSGGGRGVIRVDVSCDGGKTWKTADLIEGSKQIPGRAWAWTTWSTTLQLPSNGEVELCCKAVDTSYNVQPDTAAPIWNLRGCLSNAWHRVQVKTK